MKFNEVLKSLIAEKELTQKQVAADLHIPVSTLGGYVQGTSEPDFEMLKTLATYFHTTTDYLLSANTESTVSFEEATMHQLFKKLSKSHQKICIEQAQVLLKNQ